MEDKKRHENLEEYRLRAGILFKQLRSDNLEIVAQAAKRFRILGSLWDWSKPRDRQAWQRLERALLTVSRNRR
jgi:hypothetical protein